MHSETPTETETETVTSEERNREVNQKFSLQSEVKSTVDEKVNVDAGVTATLKYGDAVTLTPHANVTANFAKSESQSVARSYAKDLVDRSVSKIQEKVRKLQISKVISEVEEKNLHSIDNTQPGADHRAGIYYWVNKVSHARVYNYGKHMMFDVIVPEPAAIFKKLYELKLKNDKNAKAPPKPTVTPQAIQRNTPQLRLFLASQRIASESTRKWKSNPPILMAGVGATAHGWSSSKLPSSSPFTLAASITS